MINATSLLLRGGFVNSSRVNEATYPTVTLVSDSHRPVAKVAFDHRGGTRCHE